MSLVNFSNIPSEPCSISAWITPGHGFVNFDCGETMKETVGFYPSGSKGYMTDQLPPLQRHVIHQIIGPSQVGSGIGGFLSAQSGKMFKPSSSSLGSSILMGAKIKLIDSNPIFGVMKDDSEALKLCTDEELPCMVAHLNTTKENVSKAWAYFQFKKGLTLCNGEKLRACPFIASTSIKSEKLDSAKYKILGGNCIDFMHDVMDSTGVPNWQENFKFTSKPSFLHKVPALGWHYFNWLSLRKKA